MKKSKPFFIISAMRSDSSQFGHLVRHDSEPLAIEHAKNIIAKRDLNGDPRIPFYVLKIVAQVSPATAPVKVQKFK